MISRVNIVFKFSDICEFDVSKIISAVSKATLIQMELDIEEEILEVVENLIAGDPSGHVSDFSSSLNIQELLERRRQLRFLRRLKVRQISSMLRVLWMRRNINAGRSSTSAVSDPMLLTIPTPPTVRTVNSSLWQRGTVCGAAA